MPPKTKPDCSTITAGCEIAVQSNLAKGSDRHACLEQVGAQSRGIIVETTFEGMKHVFAQERCILKQVRLYYTATMGSCFYTPDHYTAYSIFAQKAFHKH